MKYLVIISKHRTHWTCRYCWMVITYLFSNSFRKQPILPICALSIRTQACILRSTVLKFFWTRTWACVGRLRIYRIAFFDWKVLAMASLRWIKSAHSCLLNCFLKSTPNFLWTFIHLKIIMIQKKIVEVYQSQDI